MATMDSFFVTCAPDFYLKVASDTVDGRTPASPGMCKTL